MKTISQDLKAFAAIFLYFVGCGSLLKRFLENSAVSLLKTRNFEVFWAEKSMKIENKAFAKVKFLVLINGFEVKIIGIKIPVAMKIK